MQNINPIINNIGLPILISYAISLILLILIIVLISWNRKIEKRYRKLTRGTNSKNIETIIHNYYEKIDQSKEQLEDLKKSILENSKICKKAITKIELMRYKAFEDVGGDLSFSIAMLDAEDNGIVITSIYSRAESNVYAKPIEKGISKYDLSREETEVLDRAIKSKKVLS